MQFKLFANAEELTGNDLVKAKISFISMFDFNYDYARSSFINSNDQIFNLPLSVFQRIQFSDLRDLTISAFKIAHRN